MTSATIVELIIAISTTLSFDPNIALAIAKTESGFKPKAVGGLGEVGVFQIRPEYSSYSKEELFDATINITEGIKKLKLLAHVCPHKDDITWIVCYNVGVVGAKKIRYPKLFPYYKKVTNNYFNIKKERVESYVKESTTYIAYVGNGFGANNTRRLF